MPHDMRRRKPKRKKPKRSQPLGISDPEALRLHRELSVLRIAGGAKPGAHKEELLDKRYEKLEESIRECEEDVITKVPCDPRKERRRQAALEREAKKINSLPMDERLDAIRDFLVRYG
jgi:hypothetical protein